MYKKILISIVLLLGILLVSNPDFSLDDIFATATDKNTQVDEVKITSVNKLPSAKFTITSKVQLSDGDSLQFGNKRNRARLFGIDSPELAQECKKNGRNWKCGQVAKNALKTKINGKRITCIGDEEDKYGRLIATCYLRLKNGQSYLDLNAWMVKNGWALAYSYYSKRYEPEQRYAQNAKLGIWQGEFQDPYIWRQNNSRN